MEAEWDGSEDSCLLVKGVEISKSEVKPVDIDGHIYTKQAHVNFVNDMRFAGLGDSLRHYRGRFYWEGPAVDVDRHGLQKVYGATTVACQEDSMGLGLIVYPVVGM